MNGIRYNKNNKNSCTKILFSSSRVYIQLYMYSYNKKYQHYGANYTVQYTVPEGHHQVDLPPEQA